ncbi:MAG: DNA polymerase III subunit epsilon [Idiomarinaceae bacterium HL-53]|nr:MAG: DNA polymerase III subunit epsilon [Idiomarinaceae bacterium HL-53]CUS47222.1 DNA polymerase-3 subunit epsilon [Idiomarinaceae bacterium HL-53]
MARWPWSKETRDWRKARWLAVDCESNGLDPRTAELLSVGWVLVEPPFVAVGQGEYRVIKSATPLNQSAVIHQLTSADLAQGDGIEQVLKALAEATQGAYLIAHHAAFDRGLLARVMRERGLVWQPAGWYDTLRAERRKLSANQQVLPQNALQLETCRARYRLPAYTQHHALADAIACGELFLAQQYHAAGANERELTRVLKRGE